MNKLSMESKWKDGDFCYIPLHRREQTTVSKAIPPS